MLKPIVIATLVAGTLDILSAFVFAGMSGVTPGGVLRYVASGPFGDAVRQGGAGWAAGGLAVHFAIMACMVAAYFLVAERVPALVRNPIVAGLVYGLILWGIMYWIVKPLRWPEALLPGTLWGIGNALFSHCILVGIPIAWIASRYFRAGPAGPLHQPWPKAPAGPPPRPGGGSVSAGYSGTPLARKLSLKDGLRTWWDGMPDSVRAEVEGDGLVLDLLAKPEAPVEAAHIFVTEREVLEERVHALLPLLAADGFIWVSWPKKASKVETDITEDVIRDVVLPLGLVDVKVCAVDSVWSGLKLVIRKELRSSPVRGGGPPP